MAQFTVSLNGETIYKGFVLSNYKEQYEVLFYVETNGDIYQSSKIRMPNDEFKAPSWYKVPCLPERAVFCGNYRKPF